MLSALATAASAPGIISGGSAVAVGADRSVATSRTAGSVNWIRAFNSYGSGSGKVVGLVDDGVVRAPG
jgi:hypothetical protein